MPISLYNHVVTSSIRSVEIVSESRYEPSSEIAKHIEAQLERDPVEFDGMCWRLNKYCFNVWSGEMVLHVGYGLYSQYRYTNLDDKFRVKVPDQREWFNAIVLGAMVETEDKKIVLTKRPRDAQLSAGRLDMPCGHPSNITKPPEDAILQLALKAVIDREFGVANRYKTIQPLLLILEEPKAAWALMFHVQIDKTSEELLKSMDSRKFGGFIDNTPDRVADFLKTQEKTARPVKETLLYYGREYFGEQWFQQFCREQN